MRAETVTWSRPTHTRRTSSDYFRDKAEIEASGEMGLLQQNYLDKHNAVNHTARALLAAGIPVIPARNLH